MSDPTCPVCATADIICGKWTILVIRDLADGSRKIVATGETQRDGAHTRRIRR